MQWASVDRSPSQVQLAIRDGRGSSGAQRSSDASGAAGSKGAAGGVGAGAAGREGGDPGALLPEGAEAALLYVRFRAAAEPGLKGAPGQTPAFCRSMCQQTKRPKQARWWHIAYVAVPAEHPWVPQSSKRVR